MTAKARSAAISEGSISAKAGRFRPVICFDASSRSSPAARYPRILQIVSAAVPSEFFLIENSTAFNRYGRHSTDINAAISALPAESLTRGFPPFGCSAAGASRLTGIGAGAGGGDVYV